MNDQQFERDTEALRHRGYVSFVEAVRARDTAQREALAQLQAEMPDLRANMTKALDLLQVLTSTKYTDRAFVKAVDEADEMLEQLRGKVVLNGLADQQEAQGAQAGDLACAVRVLLEVPQLQGEQAFSAQPIIDRVRAALATQPAAVHGDEAVRKDAERYRFLKSEVNPSLMRELDFNYLANEWDTHIDAAMRAQGDGEV